MAQAVTLTETDVGMATCKVVTATLVDEHDQKIQQTPSGQPQTWNFWNTSLGKFRFTLEELPSQLQMIYSLLIVRWSSAWIEAKLMLFPYHFPPCLVFLLNFVLYCIVLN